MENKVITKVKCSDCEFWHEINNSEYGECRNKKTQKEFGYQYSQFPKLLGDYSCGNFKAKNGE